jgi:glutathione S-transferase
MGMSVKLYGIAGSPNMRGAMLGLAEKRVEYELVEVAPPFKAPEHMARNPFGRVPVFEHDGFMLYETQAILRYVDRVFEGPELQPKDAREAGRMDQILAIIDSYLFQTWSGTIAFERLVMPNFYGQPTNVEAVEAAIPLARTCAEAVEALISGPYLTGETFSLADARLVPHLDLFRMAPDSEAILACKSKLARWFETDSQRPPVREILQPLFAPA